MKKTFLFIVTLLFAVTSASRAQPPVVDKYPEATIYIIDPQTGQEVLAQNDDAVAFKNALIDLVNNTYRVKHIIKSPGHKTLIITQSDPADGNAFQLTNQSKFLGSEVVNYTFSYSVDQNTLYYLDPASQTWQPEVVQGYNVVNLNNCLALGKFNELQQANGGGDNNNNNDAQQTADEGSGEDVTASTPPPALQDYEQPECPQDGYLWQPGYWAFNPGGGYYWVPGVWVAPPSEDMLWTPPYWGYEGNVYLFHAGYWGPHVGFYGGINYGYGYGGDGYYGGNWYGGHFRYNTAIVRVNTTRVHNVYVDRTVVHVGVREKVSFNGPGGANNRPNERELKVANENHIRDYHQDPKAASIENNHRNNPGGNNGSRNDNNFHNGNGNAPANNGGRNGNVYTPRNGNNNGGNNQNNNQNANNPRNGNATNTTPGNAPNNTRTPGNGPVRPGGPGAQRGPGNSPGAPRGPGNGPAIPKGPGHGNNGNGGNNAPRNGNGNGGQGRSGDRNKGNDKPANSGKKDDKKGN